MGIPIETVKSDEFEMRFFRFGQGERPFVILPGLSVKSVMDSAEAVAEAYAMFAENYTVYVFDRRSRLPETYSVRDMGRDTAEAMAALGLQDVFLFGASQGGMIAQVIAIEHPELVNRVVLGSTASHVEKALYRMLDRWVALAETGDGVGLYLAFGEAIYPPEVFEEARQGLADAGKTVTGEDLRRFVILAKGIKDFSVLRELDHIRCPVLAIGSYEDRVLDSDATMEIAEKLDLPPEELYLYTGYGHAAFDTAPDYKERILRFFQQ